MIEPERISFLNHAPAKKGGYVLYWMQASQRARFNHALEYAIERANELKLPCIVFFGLTDKYPEANTRHYRFMLEGLKGTAGELKKRGLLFVIRRTSPDEGAIVLAKRAAIVVCDRGYTRIQRRWREKVAKRIGCSLIEVESDVVVPVRAVSAKEEYAAATIRPKITRLLKRYLVPLRETRPKTSSVRPQFASIDIDDIDRIIGGMKLDRSVPACPEFRGGTDAAIKRLKDFIRNKLDRFGDLRNDPSLDHLSNMSPYLHFGQISPVYIALEVKRSGSPAAAAYLEELIVRRELAMNFVHYNERYDSFDCLPDWAKRTLVKHSKDSRDHIYTRGQLENASTHDPAWNAAQTEMVRTGKMHGYMRMYWGKKIIEWTRGPQEAYRVALYLNNRYELDGRDPNGFAGVAWVFGKHDRPWGERRIFGSVRYMNDKGLARKFDVGKYIERNK